MTTTDRPAVSVTRPGGDRVELFLRDTPEVSWSAGQGSCLWNLPDGVAREMHAELGRLLYRVGDVVAPRDRDGAAMGRD